MSKNSGLFTLMNGGTDSSSDDDTSEDESNLPNAETCESLCREFAAVTNTDSALAMFFLQNRKWDLQVSPIVFTTAALQHFPCKIVHV